MKVGDLVRVYNFSKKARRVLRNKLDDPQADTLENYVHGLIIGTACADSTGRHWKVMIPAYGDDDIYSENRIEVESASR